MMAKMRMEKFERKVKALIEGGKGDNCYGCGRAFVHKDKTYWGTARDGSIAVAGECCVATTLRELYMLGVYSTRRYEAYGAMEETDGSKSHSSNEGFYAVAAMRQHMS